MFPIPLPFACTIILPASFTYLLTRDHILHSWKDAQSVVNLFVLVFAFLVAGLTVFFVILFHYVCTLFFCSYVCSCNFFSSTIFSCKVSFVISVLSLTPGNDISIVVLRNTVTSLHLSSAFAVSIHLLLPPAASCRSVPFPPQRSLSFSQH